MKSLSVIGLVLLAAPGCAGLFDVDELPAEVDAGPPGGADAGDDADSGVDPCAMPGCLPDGGCADTACVQEAFGDPNLCAACGIEAPPLDCDDFGGATCTKIKQVAEDAGKAFKLTAPSGVDWSAGCGCCETGLPAAGAPIAFRAGKKASRIVSYLFPDADGPKLVALRLEWIAGGIDALAVSAAEGASTEASCDLDVPKVEGCDRAASVLLRFDGTTDPATHDSCNVPGHIVRLDFSIEGNGEAFANLRGLAVVHWAE